MRPCYFSLGTYLILQLMYFGSSGTPDSLDRVILKHSSNQENGSLWDDDRGIIYPIERRWEREALAERPGYSNLMQKPRLRKCCSRGQVVIGQICNKTLYNGSILANVTDKYGMNPKEKTLDELFEILYQNPCVDNGLSLIKEIHFFNEGKDVRIRSNDGYLLIDGIVYETDSFCIDNFLQPNHKSGYCVITCEKYKLINPFITMQEFYIVNFGYASLATSFFLVFIIALYSFGTKLSNIHEKSVFCYLCTYFSVFCTLTLKYFFYKELSPPSCLVIASLLIFTTIAKYTWANVISIKIALKFREIRPRCNKIRHHQWMSKTKKFLLYSLYAWGVPFVFVLALGIIENTPGLEVSFKKPIFTRKACFFHEMAPLVIFVAGPVYFIIFINLLLFVYTALKIFWSWRSSPLLKNDQKIKQRFNLLVKLMLMMGVPAVFHFIFWGSLSPKQTLACRYIILLIEWCIFASLLCNNKIKRNLAFRFLPDCKSLSA